MLEDAKAFSGFSVKDMKAAKAFYEDTLGLSVKDGPMGLELSLNGGQTTIFIYQKDDHQPASYTMLNFSVKDIDATVDALTAKGVSFEHYEMAHQDEKGIARGIANHQGPDIAWFTDPSGNVISVLQES